jgi:DNA-binding Lrp family transcriptional regulator
MTAHCVIHTFFGGELSVVTKAGVLEPEQERALRPERSQSRERPERSERLQRPERSQREPASAVAVLDDGDRRLLDLLATDGRTPLAELATATGWSPSTVRRRMDELQTAGVLYFDLEVDGRIFDIRVETMLWLSVAPSELEATGQALAEHPEVAYAAATTGATNLYAVLLSRDVQAVYTYLTTRIAALPAVRQVETAPVMRNVKGPGPFWSPARGAGRG